MLDKKRRKTKRSFTFLLLFLAASFVVASDVSRQEESFSGLNIDPTPNEEEGDRGFTAGAGPAAVAFI